MKNHRKQIILLIGWRLCLVLIFLLLKMAPNGWLSDYSWWWGFAPEIFTSSIVLGVLVIISPKAIKVIREQNRAYKKMEQFDQFGRSTKHQDSV